MSGAVFSRKRDISQPGSPQIRHAVQKSKHLDTLPQFQTNFDRSSLTGHTFFYANILSRMVDSLTSRLKLINEKYADRFNIRLIVQQTH